MYELYYESRERNSDYWHGIVANKYDLQKRPTGGRCVYISGPCGLRGGSINKECKRVEKQKSESKVKNPVTPNAQRAVPDIRMGHQTACPNSGGSLDRLTSVPWCLAKLALLAEPAHADLAVGSRCQVIRMFLQIHRQIHLHIYIYITRSMGARAFVPPSGRYPGAGGRPFLILATFL